MRIRTGILLIVGWLGALPSSALAQKCTLGPFTSSTSISSIASAINTASAGSVVCLLRGQVWSGSSGLNLTTSFPATSRVTVCSSDSTQCTDSGGANAQIALTSTTAGAGVRFANCAGGYEFRNVNFTGPGTVSGGGRITVGIQPDKCSHDVRFVGGAISSMWNALWSDVGSGSPANNIELGTCASPLEISRPSTGGTGDHHGSYGSWNNTAFRLYVHDWSVPLNSSRSHFLDLSYGGSGSNWQSTASSHNVTVECSHFATYLGSGHFIKAASGHNLVVRNNQWDDCQTAAIAFASHGPDSTSSWGWDQADVYGNRFDFTKCSNSNPVNVEVGSNIRIYNNIARVNAGDYQGGLVGLDCNAGAQASDNPGAHIQVFNNTIFRTGSATGNLVGLVQHNNPTCNSGVTGPTDITVVNNLFMEDSTSTYTGPWMLGSSSCNDWGTNGSQVHHNFEYAPNHAPTIPACTGDDNFIKSGSDPNATGDGWGTAPGVTNMTSLDFTISTASKVYQKGDPNHCPATDYAGNPRPSPCSIGALDVNTTGSVSPLQAPVLIQITTTN